MVKILVWSSHVVGMGRLAKRKEARRRQWGRRFVAGTHARYCLGWTAAEGRLMMVSEAIVGSGSSNTRQSLRRLPENRRKGHDVCCGTSRYWPAVREGL